MGHHAAPVSRYLQTSRPRSTLHLRSAFQFELLGLSQEQESQAGQALPCFYTPIRPPSRERSGLDEVYDLEQRAIAEQEQRLAALERQKRKLIDAYMADALPLDVLKERQTAIAAEMADAKRVLGTATATRTQVLERLERVLELLGCAHDIYLRGQEPHREVLNDVVFEALLVDTAEDGAGEPLVPKMALAPLADAVLRRRADAETPRGSKPTEGFNVNHLAAQLLHSWNARLWSAVDGILAAPPSANSVDSAPRPRRQRHVRLTPDRIQALLTDYVSGLSVAAVARKHRVDLKTATKHLVDNGVSIRQPKVALPASELPRLLELAESGMSHAELGRRYGCSRQAVHLALKRARHGLEGPPSPA